MGWFTDFFRLAWGFFYWNARKTAWKVRSTRGRCPCQHPSDSGRAWETGCEALAGWNSPVRFRRLCPLLQRTEAGLWRCSVNRSDVRPFWGRALAFHGGVALVLYLVVTLGAFTFLRTVGYAVTYPGVLWPPAWKKHPAIRAEFFLEKYRHASAAGDNRQALMALSTAYNLDPRNYQVGLLLANLSQASNPGLSDHVHQRLINEHPAQAAAIAQLWLRALIVRGDFQTIETLAASRLQASTDQAAVWMHALLFANLRTGNGNVISTLRSSPHLPAWASDLLSLHEDLGTLTPAAIPPRLAAIASNTTDPFSFFFVCRRLIQLGHAHEVITLLESRAGLLRRRDFVSLRFDALAALGWDSILRNEISSLLLADPTPAVVELLATHLIRHPDSARLALVFDRLAQAPLPDTTENYPAYLALFCAAGVGRDQPRLDWAAVHIRTIARVPFRSLDIIGRGLAKGEDVHAENHLPALRQLPFETTYALLDRLKPPPSPPGQ
ncbi:hypothetical protein Ga0100231_001515 [Opitutaceae bacterium TAV4]|nr:hypothetical protein Ga0100231_001515 [Opitutaceae bacterium TAV4]RRK01543.1 hypothetical protein Ga0100230_006670 [Opitutaceae bacterium TAV3]